MGKSSLCPGFRFYPTDVELVMYYLKKKLLGKKLVTGVIAEVNIYDFSPWDLPDKSYLRNGDLEWFFFCSKSKKYSSGSRMNRATEAGYWKATGKDRAVKYKEKTVAMIKTLVFHLGHPPKGERTNWVMHEYRMEDKDLADAGVVQEAYVLCKLFEKSGAGPKNGAQYGAPFDEKEWNDDIGCPESSVVVNLSGAINIVNPDVSSSAVTNMTSTEAGPSTVTSSAVAGLFGSTRTLNFDASGSAVTNTTLTEPGSSTITSENERHFNALANDDVMLTHEDVALILLENNIQEVEDHKGKKAITSSPNEDDGIFKDLAALNNHDDLSQNKFNIFDIDGSADLMLDDLDDDLAMFVWD